MQSPFKLSRGMVDIEARLKESLAGIPWEASLREGAFLSTARKVLFRFVDAHLTPQQQEQALGSLVRYRSRKQNYATDPSVDTAELWIKACKAILGEKEAIEVIKSGLAYVVLSMAPLEAATQSGAPSGDLAEALKSLEHSPIVFAAEDSRLEAALAAKVDRFTNKEAYDGALLEARMVMFDSIVRQLTAIGFAINDLSDLMPCLTRFQVSARTEGYIYQRLQEFEAINPSSDRYANRVYEVAIDEALKEVNEFTLRHASNGRSILAAPSPAKPARGVVVDTSHDVEVQVVGERSSLVMTPVLTSRDLDSPSPSMLPPASPVTPARAGAGEGDVVASDFQTPSPRVGVVSRLLQRLSIWSSSTADTRTPGTDTPTPGS